MAQTVDISFVPALQDTIISRFAEDPEMVRSTVRVRQITGKTDKWERLGGVDMVQVTTRHAATPHTPMTHSARLAILADWAGSELLDQLDQVKMMIDPKNDYTRNLIQAWRRRIARTIVDAINGNATSVDNADARTNVALPASQSIANGGTGFTMAKWRQANRILDNAGVTRGDRTILLSAFAIEDLMADSQVTSKDYSDLAAIQNGTIGQGARFMGARVVMISDAIPDATAVLTGGTIDPILPKTGNIRSSFLYHHDAVGLSVAKDVTAEVDQRADLMNSWQVLVQGSLGAVRILDEGCVEIDYDESV